MCVSVCGCVHMCVGVCGVQKRESGSLELEFQVVVSHQTWMLRTKLRISARIVQALNPELSPSPLGTDLKQDLGGLS